MVDSMSCRRRSSSAQRLDRSNCFLARSGRLIDKYICTMRATLSRTQDVRRCKTHLEMNELTLQGLPSLIQGFLGLPRSRLLGQKQCLRVLWRGPFPVHCNPHHRLLSPQIGLVILPAKSRHHQNLLSRRNAPRLRWPLKKYPQHLQEWAPTLILVG